MLDAHYTLARPEVVAEQVSVDGTRKWLLRLPGEHAGRAAARGRVRLHPGDRSRHAVRLQPGRLHAELLVLPHRHAAAGAQSDAGRDRRPGHGGARPARRLRRHGARARRRPADRRRPLHLQHRDDGHGRAALQFRGGARRARRGRRTATGSRISQAPHHAVDLRRGADDRARRRRDRRHAGGLAARGARRIAQRAGAAQPQISDRANCSRPAATIPACRTRGASPSNTSCSRASTIRSPTPRRWCGCSRASRPRSISSRSIRGPARQYECSDWEQIEKFSEIVFNAGYASPVRTPRGRDILAACGQLKSATEKLSARERLALRAMAMTD